MRRVMKWMMLMVMALCLLAALAYGAYLKRDTVAVWLGLAEAKPELSKTPLFKPMERFVISLEGDSEPHYLVLELALVTNKPTPFVAPILDALDIAKYFTVVIGGDDVKIGRAHV